MLRTLMIRFFLEAQTVGKLILWLLKYDLHFHSSFILQEKNIIPLKILLVCWKTHGVDIHHVIKIQPLKKKKNWGIQKTMVKWSYLSQFMICDTTVLLQMFWVVKLAPRLLDHLRSFNLDLMCLNPESYSSTTLTNNHNK